MTVIAKLSYSFDWSIREVYLLIVIFAPCGNVALLMRTLVNCARFLGGLLNQMLLSRNSAAAAAPAAGDDENGLLLMGRFLHMVEMYRGVHCTMRRVRIRVSSIVREEVVEKYLMGHYRIARRSLNYRPS